MGECFYCHMGIPPQANKVFSGVIFDAYQWQQQMFDGSEETFEMLTRPDSVSVLAVVDGELLVIDEEQPHHGACTGLVCGRVDAGEDPLAAAKRELSEETGYVSGDWELWFADADNGKLAFTRYCFVARGCRKDHEQSLDPGEKIEPRLVSKDVFYDLVLGEDFPNKDVALKLMRLRLQGKTEKFDQLTGLL